MKIKRRIAFILALLVFLMLPCYTNAQYNNVSVFFDGNEIDLGEYGAYYDADIKCVMAPLYTLADVLEYTVDYNTENGNVKILKDARSIEMTVNDRNVTINSKRTAEMDTALICDNAGNLFAPLKFLTEALNYKYSFDEEKFNAYINDKASYTLDVSFDELKEQFGQYDRVDATENGYNRYVYLNDYVDYTLIDVEEGKVVSYFVAGTDWSVECGIFGGMKLSSCDSLMQLLECTSESDGSCRIYKAENLKYTVFYDANETIYGIKIEKAEDTVKEYITDSKVTSSFALEIYDLINCYRNMKSFSPLPNDSSLALLAKNHSSSMANGNYFSHNDTNERDYQQRMKDEGYGDCYVSEIIAEAYDNGINLFSDLISDETYIDVVIANYDAVGCGVVYNENAEGLIYYTQLFYAAKD